MTTSRLLSQIFWRVGVGFAALGGLIASASASQTTYTYTAPWTYWADSSGLSRPLYAGLDGSGIKFEFTTSAPLISVGCGTNPYSIYCQSEVSSQLLSWHYNGGSSFLNLGSDVPGSVLALLLSTDATGKILNDRFYLHGPVVIPGLTGETSSLYQAHDGYDQQNLFSSYSRLYQGSPISLSEGMSNFGGSWTFATSTETNPIASNVPEPEIYAMMLAGLGLIGGIARRRKARQPA